MDANAAAQQAEAQAAQSRLVRQARRRARAARLQRVGDVLAGGWHFALRDLGGLAGMGLLAYGAWLTYPPAGFLTAGALLLAGAWIIGSKDGA